MTLAHEIIDEAMEAVRSSPTSVFSELVETGGLNRAKDLRFANWSGVDFTGDDLQGFDFTGANLKDCCFEGTLIDGARFDLAEVDRLALMKARDWEAHVRSWKPAPTKVTTFQPRSGTIFSHAPFAPEMVALPAGHFLMGSSEDEKGRSDNEGPQHEVTIDYRLAVGRFPVTVAEYDSVMSGGKEPKPEPGPGGERIPATDVRWNDAKAYCEALSRLTGVTHRLLSEAEWEFACRGGSTTPFPWGDNFSDEMANKDVFGTGRKAVGRYLANAWGLHDMVGGIGEWCADHYHDSYQNSPSDGAPWLNLSDPQSSGRVVRGGSWFYSARYARAAIRNAIVPGYRNESLGFRCAGVLS